MYNSYTYVLPNYSYGNFLFLQVSQQYKHEVNFENKCHVFFTLVTCITNTKLTQSYCMVYM